ncbi:4-alpha-glucanotransferase [Microvirga sp. STS02]|uniref:4-alpha-glucanotransferase n=1 Tax=Hymenobacter negativus TaxID=2795026 RepID=UPI0018DB15F3|nr:MULTISPECIES: 4-alpha-glucanotransferase [Bacteria]MBH8570891.1 4-alpha-glucanotransferase [Hymenobacter negativus]MBR7210628.1 4-alpha-glucanotransferase [Microvirga sp. STS02]
MILRFSLPYRTVLGQRLAVCGSHPDLGSWQPNAAADMNYDEATTCWSLELTVPDAVGELTYKYVLRDDNTGGEHWEAGPNRRIAYDASRTQRLHLADYWRAPAQPENELLTAAFTKALFRRPAKATAAVGTPAAPAKKAKAPAAAKGSKAAKATTEAAPALPTDNDQPTTKTAAGETTFRLLAPRVAPQLGLCILGSDPALGAWDNTKALVLSDADYPTWSGTVTLQNPTEDCYYKYAMWDAAAGHALDMEGGENRVVPATPDRTVARVFNDEAYQYATAWRGAGVALPVFAMRSAAGLGVGEFSDLKLLTDWAVQTGLKLVQILPINDTTATHTWVDSYPYAAISVFALHPQFIHLEGIATLKDKKAAKELAQLKQEFNAKDFVDYEPVMNAKWKFLKLLYKQEKAGFLADPEYREFFASQADWLVPYAAFSALRDRFGTADFQQWPEEFRTPANVAALTAETAPDYDDYGLFFFTQFHLDKQLRAAVDYARSRGVVLKGDLPIGIYRHSVDAWTQPELYHMNAQAGAPPDDFSTTGQNWRFPTYNWERMAEDGYLWWKQRMSHLARYFDTLRIDHILGFFRIWEMPIESVEGLLGHFAPALPLHRHEIERRLGWFDYSRLCEPYIRWHMLQDIFQGEAQNVFDEYMDDASYGRIHLKEAVSDQRKIEAYIAEKVATYPEHAEYFAWLQKGLFALVNEVLFVPAGDDFYHPRITLNKSYSFRELDSDEDRRRLYDDIYVDFFFRRHEEFWRQQGLVKLPPVRYATDMLICGEDLGMVPASVPGVMKELGILGLNIQRMPSNPETEFGHPDSAPYLSVVTTSSHDMSTVRGWWEEDRVRTQRFYETVLGHWREVAPFYCEPWVGREILVQHLHSPAMWAIFPLQDLLAIDGHLRRANPHEEQINVPSNPAHFWKYRLHLPLEELVQAVGFNEPLHQLVQASGRG